MTEKNTCFSFDPKIVCNAKIDDEWWPISSPPPTLKQIKQMNKKKEKYLIKHVFPFCDMTNKFRKLTKIDKYGTYGEEFKTRYKNNPKQFVTLKKILMGNKKEGFSITALRELRVLQLLKHENVVTLLEVCQTKACLLNHYRSTFILVFEFCDHDLASIIANSMIKICLSEIKQILKQILNGLHYIHTNKILHRDIKSANVLITKTGILKLADFGLARTFSSSTVDRPNKFTNCVVTLWYRSPELLLGDHNYGPPIDLWGVGCIMAEMWTRYPIFQANSEQGQLTKISELCGSITPRVWPKVVHLNLYNKLELVKGKKQMIKEKLKPYLLNSLAVNLLEKLLTLDPEKRINANLALDHNFFWTDPMPCNLSKLLMQIQTCNHEHLFKYQISRTQIL